MYILTFDFFLFHEIGSALQVRNNNNTFISFHFYFLVSPKNLMTTSLQALENFSKLQNKKKSKTVNVHDKARVVNMKEKLEIGKTIQKRISPRHAPFWSYNQKKRKLRSVKHLFYYS